jgi:Fructose-bisphosphate aldolase class-I
MGGGWPLASRVFAKAMLPPIAARLDGRRRALRCRLADPRNMRSAFGIKHLKMGGRRVAAMTRVLPETAPALLAKGKGILAADETVPTLTRRFDALGIASTEQGRRTYREMLFTAPGAAEFISGVTMQDETIRQKSSTGVPLAQVLAKQGIVPGIKVDNGAKPLAGSPGETVTEGLDGLRDRLAQ